MYMYVYKCARHASLASQLHFCGGWPGGYVTAGAEGASQQLADDCAYCPADMQHCITTHAVQRLCSGGLLLWHIYFVKGTSNLDIQAIE